MEVDSVGLSIPAFSIGKLCDYLLSRVEADIMAPKSNLETQFSRELETARFKPGPPGRNPPLYLRATVSSAQK